MLIDKMIGDKRRWRQYKARTRQLPANYRTAVEAIERYLMYYGGITKGDIAMTMMEDLADLFEQSAATATPIRAVVGDDPVEFVESFLENYSDGRWINKERDRLVATIDRVTSEEAGHDDGSVR